MADFVSQEHSILVATTVTFHPNYLNTRLKFFTRPASKPDACKALRKRQSALPTSKSMGKFQNFGQRTGDLLIASRRTGVRRYNDRNFEIHQITIMK
ncbi:MAG: hypothetical protein R2788_12415 [Saprospiraceae bacterium]